MNIYDSPQMFGINHDDWRKHQLETIKWIAKNGHRTMFVEALVGSGKSAVGAALKRYGVVRVLTYAKNLQRQYDEGYNLATVYGMSNYECELNPMFMADACVYSDNMTGCPVAHDCGYLNDRTKAASSQAHALSYAYYLTSMNNEGTWVAKTPVDFLYLDEAHLVPDLVRENSAIEVKVEDLKKMNVPMFPTYNMPNDQIRLKKAINWLQTMRSSLAAEHAELLKILKLIRVKQIGLSKKIRFISNKIDKLDRVIYQATARPYEFFADWSPKRIRIIPLTARYFFSDLFLNNGEHKLILTSATIGNPDILATELGLPKGTYRFRAVPSSFPPDSMPIFLMKDAPRMSAKSNNKAKDKQADLIAKAIKSCDPSWSALVHVSSVKQADALSDRLARRGLQDRIYIPKGMGTQKKIDNWQSRLKRKKNTVAVSYSFHQGLDAPDININIVAKIPFGMLDSFGMAELKRNPKLYNLKAGVKLEQASGRIRRGEKEHYEEKGQEQRKLVAVADMNYTRVKKSLSDFYKSCVVDF